MSRDHERHAESTGAYLLRALPELEREAFERHVMGCSDCRDEVERLRVAADALPRSVTPLNPSPALKRSLMRLVEADVAADAPRESRAVALRRRLALPRIRPAMAWVSAAFLLGVGIAGGFGAASLGDHEGGQSVAATVDETRLAEGSASLFVPERDGEQAILNVHGLPHLPEGPDDIYQLWLVRGNEVIPSSVFTVSADGSGGAAVDGDLDGVDSLWVTREEAGGARAPTESPVMRVKLS